MSVIKPPFILMLVFCVNLSLSFFLGGFNQQTIFLTNAIKRKVKMFLIALTIKFIFHACAFLYFIQLQTMFFITAIRCTFPMVLNTLNTKFVFIPASVFLYNFICILNKVKVVVTFTFYRLFFSICFILIVAFFNEIRKRFNRISFSREA